MRLPTPSTRRLDGVEGDLYRWHGVLFAGAASNSSSFLFLVCYIDASCRAFCWFGLLAGAALVIQRVLLCK